MPTQTEILQLRLTEAENAYHQLVTGSKAMVIVDSNLERVEFAKTDLGKLRAYIEDLKRQLGLVPAGSTGPMGVWF